MKKLILSACLLAFGASIAPAQTKSSAPDTPVIAKDDHLYQAFGGHDGLVRIMDDFMVNLLADPRTEPFFGPANQVQIKALLVEQFCVILGGPCQYSGRSMKEAHQGMNVGEDNFYALVEALQKAMNKNHVPFSAQNKLLAALAPQHRDIVEK